MKQIIFITILFLVFSFAVFAQIPSEQHTSIKFDEFERLNDCEEGARLDNFLIELSKKRIQKV